MMITSPPPPEVSVIVANWNGGEWIARCLSSLQISAQLSGRSFEIIAVDDVSSDGSAEEIARRFPRVRLLAGRVNVGFARVINRGVRAARGRVVVLCNNDLVAKEEFVGRLTAPLLEAGRAESPLFAVSARTVAWHDGAPNQLCMGAVWRGGRVTPAWSDPKEAAPCLFAQAGAAAYDRELLLQLGGLATFYEPGYWEDYDLSWRAARRGWRQLYEPAAFALHVGGGSMSRRYGAAGVARMKARNHVLFECANLRSPRLLAEWGARLPLSAARSALRSRWAGSLGCALADAAARLPSALAARLADGGHVSDEELLKPFKNFTPSF